MTNEHSATHEWHRRHDDKLSKLRLEQIKHSFALDEMLGLLRSPTSPTSSRTEASLPPTSATSTATSAATPTTASAPVASISRVRWLLALARKFAPKIGLWVLEKVWTYLWPLLWGVAVAAFTWAQMLAGWLRMWWMLLAG
jgi:hypothetical protein